MEMEKEMKEMKKKKERSRNAQSNVIIIPEEIVFEIMSRLPAKSLSRFRCVSKHWNSTISDRRFVELHHNRSLSRPGGTNIFITFPLGLGPIGIGQIYIRCIYSAVDHLRHHRRHQRVEEEEEEEDDDAVRQCCLPLYLTSYISHSLHGLICFVEEVSILILNPSTRDCIGLPPTTQSDKTYEFDSCSGFLNVTLFGYDPVNNQHKVLNTRLLPPPPNSKHGNQMRMITKHRVFVLGGASWSWRVILDVPPHFPCRMDDVCFNGFVYYRAFTSIVREYPRGGEVLVEFDVNLETFRFIPLPSDTSLQPLKNYDHASALIQVNGHLAVVDYQNLKKANTLDIWTLEDSLKPIWVHKTVVFSSPAGWTDSLDGNLILDGPIGNYFLAGTSRTGEIIIAPHTVIQPFYLFYLDLKNRSLRRVKIGSLPCSGMTLGSAYTTVTVTDHVENILSLTHLMCRSLDVAIN